MRVAVDTNILLRAIVRDDAQQAAEAEALLARADPVVVPLVALCELAWVLRSTHKYSPAEIYGVLSALVSVHNVEVDQPFVDAGLRMLKQGGDFADGCILEQARASRCRSLATFDRKLSARGAPMAAHPAQIV